MMTHFAFKKDYHNIYALCVFLSLSFRSLLIFGGLWFSFVFVFWWFMRVRKKVKGEIHISIYLYHFYIFEIHTDCHPPRICLSFSLCVGGYKSDLIWCAHRWGGGERYIVEQLFILFFSILTFWGERHRNKEREKKTQSHENEYKGYSLAEQLVVVVQYVVPGAWGHFLVSCGWRGRGGWMAKPILARLFFWVMRTIASLVMGLVTNGWPRQTWLLRDYWMHYQAPDSHIFPGPFYLWWHTTHPHCPFPLTWYLTWDTWWDWPVSTSSQHWKGTCMPTPALWVLWPSLTNMPR